MTLVPQHTTWFKHHQLGDSLEPSVVCVIFFFFVFAWKNCLVSFPANLNMAEMTHVCAQNKMVMVSGLALILNQPFYLGTF